MYPIAKPNGAGKTTLLKMLTGLITPSFGSITLFGQDRDASFASVMRKVGCMIESADFHEYLTAGQYLKLNANFYPEVGRERIAEVLEMVGLETYAKEKIGHFSTGMKQACRSG